MNVRLSRAAALARGDLLSTAAVAALLLLLLLGCLGPWLGLGDPNAIGAGPRLAPPGGAFPLGTDELGRAFLPRVVAGILVTFLLSAAAVLLTAAAGTLIGLLAAYFGGAADMVIARLTDVLAAFPAIILGMLTAALVGPGNTSVIIVIVAATLPMFVRVVRSVGLGVAGREFVVVAEIAGAGPLRIVLVHLLPNVAGALIVQLTYALSLGMLIESGLSFLGLGTQPPYASLGSLLQLGATYLSVAPWLALAPGLVLALAIVSVNLLGDGLRDAFDPLPGRRLR
jgi:peptide/nickel transport system permease protein